MQERGCEFLALLAGVGGAEVTSALSACGAVESIVHAMASFRKEEDVQQQGCFALQALAKTSTALAEDICAAEGITILSQTLSDHRSVPLVADRACLALLALLGGEDITAVRSQCLRCGTAGIAVRALQESTTTRGGKQVARGMRLCCKLLGRLLVDAGGLEMQLAIEQVLTADGTLAVVNAMHALVNDQELQELGFTVLCCLACSPEGYESVSKVGGLAAARRAAEFFPSLLEQAMVLCKDHESAALFLQGLAAGDEGNTPS